MSIPAHMIYDDQTRVVPNATDLGLIAMAKQGEPKGLCAPSPAYPALEVKRPVSVGVDPALPGADRTATYSFEATGFVIQAPQMSREIAAQLKAMWDHAMSKARLTVIPPWPKYGSPPLQTGGRGGAAASDPLAPLRVLFASNFPDGLNVLVGPAVWGGDQPVLLSFPSPETVPLRILKALASRDAIVATPHAEALSVSIDFGAMVKDIEGDVAQAVKPAALAPSQTGGRGAKAESSKTNPLARAFDLALPSGDPRCGAAAFMPREE